MNRYSYNGLFDLIPMVSSKFKISTILYIKYMSSSLLSK